jgi:hypothetical protein
MLGETAPRHTCVMMQIRARNSIEHRTYLCLIDKGKVISVLIRQQKCLCYVRQYQDTSVLCQAVSRHICARPGNVRTHLCYVGQYQDTSVLCQAVPRHTCDVRQCQDTSVLCQALPRHICARINKTLNTTLKLLGNIFFFPPTLF